MFSLSLCFVKVSLVATDSVVSRSKRILGVFPIYIFSYFRIISQSRCVDLPGFLFSSEAELIATSKPSFEIS